MSDKLIATGKRTFGGSSGKKLTRRDFVGGLAAGGAAAVGLGFVSVSPAKAARRIVPTGGSGRRIVATSHPHQLFEHHCKLVHRTMGEKLTRIASDPSISNEVKTVALRTTKCPCCNTQISASFPYQTRKRNLANV